MNCCEIKSRFSLHTLFKILRSVMNQLNISCCWYNNQFVTRANIRCNSLSMKRQFVDLIFYVINGTKVTNLEAQAVARAMIVKVRKVSTLWQCLWKYQNLYLYTFKLLYVEKNILKIYKNQSHQFGNCLRTSYNHVHNTLNGIVMGTFIDLIDALMNKIFWHK